MAAARYAIQVGDGYPRRHDVPGREMVSMYVRQTRRARQQLVGSSCLAAVVIVGVLALAGCGGGSKANAASNVQNCGPSKTAANVPVEVEIYRGSVSCGVAMKVEKSYAEAIVSGHAAGNGGGAPVTVSGWTCQGLPTPEVIKTGDVSKCAKSGTEIVEVLKTSS